MAPLRILLLSSEVAPFAKTGGLADVAAALTRYLARAGHEAKLCMPLYQSVQQSGFEFQPHPRLQGLRLAFGQRQYVFSVQTAKLPHSEVEVLFLHCPELFGRAGIYTWDRDEHVRFGLFSRAALEICQWLQWGPDVIHCNDWHSALTPLYLKTGYAWDRLFEHTHSVLTIHNIGYQGVFPAATVDELGFGAHRQLLHQGDLSQGKLNFLKTGAIYADALTTVSETYAREIQTADFGMGLQDLLRARSDSVIGIVNGVDYGEWDPATDTRIPQHFSRGDLSGKRACKQQLLARLGLTPTVQAPLFGIVSRLTAQKGFELLPEVLQRLLRQDLRLAVLGSGEERYESYFHWLHGAHPGKVAFRAGYDDELAHQIEAGSDLFLMPSLYEPCGLNQMYSLRYGTVPIVRRTGGLADTVEPFDPATGRGTGFLFDEFSQAALQDAIQLALRCFADRPRWQRLVQNGMARDFSWERQGRHYVDLYRRLSTR